MPDVEKWQLLHNQRLTIAITSAKVGVCFSYQAAVRTGLTSALISRSAINVTIENNPKSAGVVRAIARSLDCLWVSTPKCARASSKLRHDSYEPVILSGMLRYVMQYPFAIFQSARGKERLLGFLAAAVLAALSLTQACATKGESMVELQAGRQGTSLPPLFDPNHQPAVMTETPEQSIHLIEATRCEKCVIGKRFVFELRDNKTGEVKRFAFENTTEQVDSIAIVNRSRAAILGRWTSLISQITVVDTTSSTVLDTFYCIDPALSPDQKRLAYLPVIPRNAKGVDASYVYAIYDLTLPPETNRVNGKVQPDDLKDVGLPIYPYQNRQERTLNPRAGTVDGIHYQVSRQLIWLKENVIAFVDRQEHDLQHSTVRLVTVDVSRGIDKALAREVSLNEPLLKTTRCTDEGNPLQWLLVNSIRVSHDNPDVVELALDQTDHCVTAKILSIPISQ